MTSENSKRRSRLFSRLMVEEYQKLPIVPPSPLGNYVMFEGDVYLLFLKAQRKTRNPWCPYGMAVKALEAR